MKKLMIDVSGIQQRREKPHLDSIDALLAEEHYGQYLVIKKKEQRVSQRIYLSFSHHLEYHKMRKEILKINAGNKPIKYEYHLFTQYPQKKEFIADVLKQLLPEREAFARTKSILIAFSFYLEIMIKHNINLNTFADVKTEHQRWVWEALTNNNKIEMLSLFFSAIAAISDDFRWLKPTKIRYSHNIKALDTTVVFQINHFSKLEIKKIIAGRKEYLSWIAEYEFKELFSLENLAHTYYEYIKKHGSNANGRIFVLNKLANALHQVNLKSWNYISKGKYFYINNKQKKEHLRLKELAMSGSDIWITDEKMFALWFHELCPDFPISKDVQPQYKEVYTNIQAFRDNVRKKLDIDIIAFDARIFPSSAEIYPLILLLMIHTNLNSEVLRDWKVEYINNAYTLGVQTGLGLRVEGVKKRGNTYQSVVISNDSFEKQALDYYLNWLQPIFTQSKSKLFFQYVNSIKGNVINEFKPGRYFTKVSGSKRSLFNKYEIIDDAENRVLRIDHRQLRTTGNYMNYLRGLSEFERQVKLGHSDIKTQKYYINSDDWKNKGRHEILKTQEVIVNIAQGKTTKTEFGKKFNAILADCSSPDSPDYPGAPQLRKNEICSDWLKCLTHCSKSIVIPMVHGAAIVAWREFLEEQKDMFLSLEFWEKEYGMDYEAACTVLNGFDDDELAHAKDNANAYRSLVSQRFRKKIKVRIDG